MKLTDISGISHKKEELFRKINIQSIGDLISYFPRQYEDLSQISLLKEALFSENRLLIKATIESVKKIPTKRKIALTQVKIKDSVSTAYLNIFGNQPYYRSLLEIGETYLISGVFSYGGGKISSSQFSVEKKLTKDEDGLEESLNYNRIVPLYGLTPGLTQKTIRDAVFKALNSIKELPENLPYPIIKNHGLMERKEALFEIHFPFSYESLQNAKYRLKYYELFKLQFQFALKKQFASINKPQEYLKDSSLQEKLIHNLPFQLTGDQKKAICHINEDMSSKTCMHRLLMGDVGSGKTLVAIVACLKAIESGYQAVFLAPTEVLAKQHFQVIQKLLNPYFITTHLLMGSTKQKDRTPILKQLKTGECSLLIGTHAIFSDQLVYHSLSLIIIDEQHKFGVEQRAKLVGKSLNPDLLIMSATPIPRTLTYSLFGDMEVSTLHEKPSGRKAITTYWSTGDDIALYYEMVKKEIEKGHQCYIVFPLIEESEVLDLKSLLRSYKELTTGFFSFTKTSLLHGKMSEDEKTESLKQFNNGESKVLISTTVIEVGVDIPNATMIIIEEAHRFGLSTLHQLRGRVGRSDLDSYCVLSTPIVEKLTDDGIERMKIMVEHFDGFLIAQKDLELRGTGNLLGHEQKGRSGLKITSLVTDTHILEKARKDAFDILDTDPECLKDEHNVLKPLIDQFKKEYLSILHN